MSTSIQHADGSKSIRADGCAPDFLAHLATHRACLARLVASEAPFLDGSWESIKRLDEVLAEHKQAPCLIPRAMIEGTIAYCGEVLRTSMGGEWVLLTCPADAWGGPRYFPRIRSATGQELEVAALVEDECERTAGSRLYPLLFGLTLTPLLVEKWVEHPLGNMFPLLMKSS